MKAPQALICLQRINNFLLFHAIILFVLDVNGLYYTLLYFFWDQPILLFYCLFQYFEEKEYQTESKQNETFGRVICGTEAIQETWRRHQGSFEQATRVQGAPYPPGRAPTLVGPLWLAWPTSFAYICPYTLKTSGSRIDQEFRARSLRSHRKPIGSLFRHPAEGGIPVRWPSSSCRCSP